MVQLPGDYEGAGLAAALQGEAISSDLLNIVSAISRAVVDIGVALRAGSNGFSTGQVGTQNTFGDDPLEGSSIVDANFTVGSIFGVWEGKTLLNRTGREQKAAIMAMYGPRITMALAIAGRSGGMELTYFENE